MNCMGNRALIRRALWALGGVAIAAATAAGAQVEVRPLTAHWNEGSADCAAHPQPPLEVHRIDARTYVLRENPCSTWEAPFMYLVIGDTRALLIDTGDVADPRKMPLARTVLRLVPSHTPLLVVHTHRHLDHRAGDPQFVHRPNVDVVGYDLASVKHFYGFNHWPEGRAQIDLGNRIVDVIPAPGHEATHVVFYDRNTTLLFSGDFLMPGRLMLDDPAADLASAERVAAFARNLPVSGVLGGHIEEDAAGKLFPWQSTDHPHEHDLAMTKQDLLALPAALQSFNGFYSRTGKFVITDPIRNLEALVGVTLATLVALITGVVIYLRRRARRRSVAIVSGGRAAS